MYCLIWDSLFFGIPLIQNPKLPDCAFSLPGREQNIYYFEQQGFKI
jgi:hypothetical protein